MSESQNKTTGKGGGIGVGSASIVLIFAVICLTVFTLITYIVASNSKALTDAEAELVTGYYAADAQAERILAEISALSASGELPAAVLGVDLQVAYDEQLGIGTVSYYCPIYTASRGETAAWQSEAPVKSLYVNLAIGENSYDILSWRIVDLDEWVSDGGINVWSGE